jgi:hypothetical protein
MNNVPSPSWPGFLPDPVLTAWCFGAALVLFAAVGVTYWWLERRSHRPAGRIYGIVGRMGQGKSLFAVVRIIIPTVRCGYRVVTNFDCELPDGSRPTQLNGRCLWEELQYVRDSVVVLDETHMYAPSSQMAMVPEASWWCSMARKCGSDLYWISQNVMKVHKRLRDDSHGIWKVEKLGNKSFRALAFEPERIESSVAQPYDKRRYRLTDQAIAVYNSFELIPPYSLTKRRSDGPTIIPWPRRVELLGTSARVAEYLTSPIRDDVPVPDWVAAYAAGGWKSIDAAVVDTARPDVWQAMADADQNTRSQSDWKMSPNPVRLPEQRDGAPIEGAPSQSTVSGRLHGNAT